MNERIATTSRDDPPTPLITPPTPVAAVPLAEPRLEHPTPIRPRVEPRRERTITPVGEADTFAHFADITAWKAWHEQVECSVCVRKFSRADIPLAGPTRNCDHPRIFVCTECLQNYVDGRIKETFNLPHSIGCPVSTCGEVLKHDDIATWVHPDVFRRYEAALARHRLRTCPNYVMCTHCGADGVHLPGSSQPMFTCSECHHSTCFDHRVQWHIGLTCQEYQRRQDPGWIQCIKPDCTEGGFRIGKTPRAMCSKCRITFCIEHRKVYHSGTCEEYSLARGLVEADAPTYESMNGIKICPSCKRLVSKEGGCDHIECFCGCEFSYNDAPLAYIRIG